MNVVITGEKNMIRKYAIDEIKNRWREIIPQLTTEAKRRTNGEVSYICPICGHGKGGDGLTFDPKSKERNALHCFGCGFHGSIIDLYSECTGKDFITAVSDLTDLIGITIDENETTKAETPTEGEKDVDYYDYYDLCIKRVSDPDAMQYLQEKRGLSAKMIEAFGIGFDRYSDPATVPGSMYDNEPKPHAEPRVIIPCTKDWYIARAINPNADPKVSYPKGSKNALFNSTAISDGEVVFLCEGAIDAISIIQCGYAATAYNSSSNYRRVLDYVDENPTECKFIIVPDNDTDNEQTKKNVENLKRGLNERGYDASIYNAAGTYHDINDALLADPDGLKQRLDEAVRENDEIGRFLAKITSGAYREIKTGLDFFDDLLGGGILPQTTMMLLGAPASGKSTLCGQIAAGMAERKQPFLYVNLEMSVEQMLAKNLSARLARDEYTLTAKEILQGHKWKDNTNKCERVFAAAEEYRRTIAPYLKYKPESVRSDLESIVTYMENTAIAAEKKGQKAPAVCIDYLHLITSNKKQDVAEIIKEALDRFKSYAIRHDTFVIVISAINRESMKDGGKVTMNSARDTSGVEYNGDYIVALNADKDVINTGGEYKRLVEIALVKGRLDTMGKKDIYLDGARNRFI